MSNIEKHLRDRVRRPRPVEPMQGDLFQAPPDQPHQGPGGATWGAAAVWTTVSETRPASQGLITTAPALEAVTPTDVTKVAERTPADIRPTVLSDPLTPAAAASGEEGAPSGDSDTCGAGPSVATPPEPAPVVEEVQAASVPTQLPDTLADVLHHLERMPPRVRKVMDMKSAVRRMGEVLRRPLNEVPAEPSKLRPLLEAACHATAGISTVRWSRIRSLTMSALKAAGVGVMPGRDVCGHSTSWMRLSGMCPDKSVRVRLSRFMSHCTRVGIEPHQVTREVFDSYREALESRQLKSNPESLFRGAVSAWNRAVQSVEGWPQLPISLDRHPRFYSLDWSEFPSSFQRDVEAFLTDKGSDDIFSDDYVRPVKPKTLALRRQQIRQSATALVNSGFPVEQLTELSVLVTHGVRALEWQRDRRGEVTTWLENKAWLLRVIAKYWVNDTVQAEKFRKLAKALSRPRSGMTERNQARLRQFDHKPNLMALLRLPQTIFARAARQKAGDADEARAVMLALAVELLIVAPIRVDNLAGLEHARHLVVLGRGKTRQHHIVIPAHETKGGVAIEIVLPEATSLLLHRYMETYRPRIYAGSCPYLFPGRGGGKHAATTFSTAISKFVERETGLKLHCHLFRQLAGKIILDCNPNSMETVRRILGHSNTATTARYYVGYRMKEAFREYDKTLNKLRGMTDSDLDDETEG
jgi:integrase